MNSNDQGILVVQRENNPCRSFLFLNPLQGKYMPAQPAKVLETFAALSGLLEDTDTPTAVIAFAETATAIGAILAKALGDSVYYIHSSRENLGDVPLLGFREEHSHAKNHQLSLKNKEVLKQAKRVIFVDDEFTTGKTVLSFVAAMREAGALAEDADIHFLSYLNAMESEKAFENAGIDYHFAKRLALSIPLIWPGEKLADVAPIALTNAYDIHHISGALDSRHGVKIEDYHSAVESLAREIAKRCPLPEKADTALVLGTEECMYPALICAQYLGETWGIAVENYATSRSPIVPRKGGNYPLFSRGKLPSFYDKERITYLYNLKKYDKIILISDGNEEIEVLEACARLLSAYGNEDISFVFWGDYENKL